MYDVLKRLNPSSKMKKKKKYTSVIIYDENTMRFEVNNK